jgi:hypothetical protein
VVGPLDRPAPMFMTKDEKVRQLRRRFQTATTGQDYEDVGLIWYAALSANCSQMPSTTPTISGRARRPRTRMRQEVSSTTSRWFCRVTTTRQLDRGLRPRHQARIKSNRQEAGIAAEHHAVNLLRRLDSRFEVSNSCGVKSPMRRSGLKERGGLAETDRPMQSIHGITWAAATHSGCGSRPSCPIVPMVSRHPNARRFVPGS